jgi:hypothetical protein
MMQSKNADDAACAAEVQHTYMYILAYIMHGQLATYRHGSCFALLLRLGLSCPHTPLSIVTLEHLSPASNSLPRSSMTLL